MPTYQDGQREIYSHTLYAVEYLYLLRKKTGIFHSIVEGTEIENKNNKIRHSLVLMLSFMIIFY